MSPTLSVREYGSGLPVLIVHGWEMDSSVEELDFEPIVSKSLGLHRIYVDLPGMGRTPAGNIRNQDDIYHHLTRFIGTRLSSSRFLLVGSSCGAYLSRAVAAKYRDRIDGLLLRVPLIEPTDSMRDTDPFTPLIENEQVVSSMSAEDKKILGSIPIQTPAYIDALKAKYEAVVLPAMELANNDVLNPIRANPQKYQLSFFLDVAQVKFLAPILIVCGRQDESAGYRDALRLLEIYPRSTYIALDRGTHGLPVDETGVFQALVHDWIFRVHEWRDRMVK